MRDFTYIDDIVEGVLRVLDNPPRPIRPSIRRRHTPVAARGTRVFSIGNNQPTVLMDYIAAGGVARHQASKRLLPVQPGRHATAATPTALGVVGLRPTPRW